MIIPKGHRVLVIQDTIEEHDPIYKAAKAAGLELALDNGIRYQASVDVGTVVAIGETAWKDFGGEPWANVGDVIVFAKNAGKPVIDPKEKELPAQARTHYVIMNDEDVIAVVNGE